MADEAVLSPFPAGDALPATALPLAGIKVVDLSHVAAGPFCSSLLGQLGADVIKVERPGMGELNRAAKPNIGTGPVSYYFATVNVQKRFVQVDLRTPEGQEILHRLVRDADVVVQNFSAGVVERLAADYQTLKAINDRLVYCSIVGFRGDSEYAGFPSFDYIHEAMSGVMSMTGYPGEAPPLPGLPAADMSAAIYAVLGIVLALQNRERTGRGDNLEVPLQDCLLSMMPLRMGFTFATGEPYPAMGRYHQEFAPFGVFDTSDSRLVLAIGSQELWRNLVAVIPDLDEDRFATFDQRVTLKDLLHRRVGELLRAATTAEWMQRFRAARVPAGPVMTTAEAASDPYMDGLARELPVEGGSFRWVPYPVRHEAMTPELTKAPGPPGSDTSSVLDAYGYSFEQIADLHARGIVDGR